VASGQAGRQYFGWNVVMLVDKQGYDMSTGQWTEVDVLVVAGGPESLQERGLARGQAVGCLAGGESFGLAGG